ncbi:MAG TPA: AAA family ATPase [Bryobacteraceae bacterium]|nr:AAA family ATPase [Bryobacteraceae bacterium]HPT28676.1 AAA family ATPase [Bryobacteraceae bacterium]
MALPTELPPDQLNRRCDPNCFTFATTAELPPLGEFIGQPRAVAALEFGLDITSHGFHLFALGQPGSGRTTLIREYLETRAATQTRPPDLCFVHNFQDDRCPLPLRLPPGRGSEFRKAVEALVAELTSAIPKAFEAPEYVERRDSVVADVDAARKTIFEEMEKLVGDAGFKLLKGESGMVLAPAISGVLMPETVYSQLPKEEKERIGSAREKLQKSIEVKIRAAREAEKAARDQLRELDTRTAAWAVRHLVDDVRAKYHGLEEVLDFLGRLEQDVVENSDTFIKTKDDESPQNPILALMKSSQDNPFTRYSVNVLVDHTNTQGAPVIVETNPTYHNLIGRIEHQAMLGDVKTNHTMIKAGALHRANGGYLLLPARECLMNPYAWEALKRALKSRELDVEELGTQLSLVSTVTLDPEPVPLDVKVVLVGSSQLYYMLAAYDEDFQKLFKVKAEFASRMRRTAESEQSYALFVGDIARDGGLMPFDRSAVARVIEFGTRLADDQQWLTTRFGEIADLVHEAAHRARRNGNCAVTAADVKAAEQARRFRQNLAEERVQQMMVEGTIILETEGSAVGRLNGLTVISMGDYAFGHPARITAATGPGKAGVVSIEREVDLSGPIHGKGVLILSGYLLRQYGSAGPLSLSSSLVFEQTYGMVDGDSASLAELLVLLSSLSGVGLRQEIAVTGSVNQHGQVQPIGGATQKIEGYFDLCSAKGLTGTQGVMIPATNQANLTLRDDIVAAVEAGKFHVYAASGVDEALELLTGAIPGSPSEDGSIHQLVAKRLAEFSSLMKPERPAAQEPLRRRRSVKPGDEA